jgi:hypothetical protein
MAEKRLETEGLDRLDWLESGLREVLLNSGAQIVAALLADPALRIPGDQRRSGEKTLGRQARTVHTLFGPIELSRRSYYDPAGQCCRYPLDEALQLLEGFTPAAAKLVCRSGAREPYQIASEDLAAYAGIHVDARRIQRLLQRVGPAFKELIEEHNKPSGPPVPRMYISADGTGIPLRRQELKGRKGRQPDGSAKTHEVKIGCIFTQHPKDGNKPLRDLDSTSYVGTMHRAAPFADLLLAEARRRNMGAAKETIFISDGAKWLKEIARTCFPQATRILDFYHAAEHLHELVNTLHTPGSTEAKRRAKKWTRWLLRDNVDGIISEATELASQELAQDVAAQLVYFRENRQAMMYGTFRKRGLFIGSGVVEAGCKSLIGKRLKQSGMFWSEPGADNVLAIRCALYSRRLDDLWQQNVAAKLLKAA